MFDLAGGLVTGGWDAVSNIVSGIGSDISHIGSTFFPTAQRTKVISEITQSAGGQGDIFRENVLPENISMIETAKFVEQQWLGSPYEDQFAIPIKNQESMNLASIVSMGPDPITGKQSITGQIYDKVMGNLKGVAGATKEITTVVDEIATMWGLREPISGGKQEIGNSPGSTANTQPPKTTGADVISAIKGLGSGIADQVKGLYNLAFGQQGSQAAFEVQHEIKPTTGLSIGMIAAVGAIILVLILTRRK